MATTTELTAMLHGKPVHLRISPRAQAALASRGTPLRAEMELYFSCLIAKAVRFDGAARGNHFEPAAPGLEIGFNAVQTQGCSIASLSGPRPPREGFPIVRPERFVPKWLALDFRDGEWSGSFGLVEAQGAVNF